METALYLIIGSLLIFLAGKDLLTEWLKLRGEGKSTQECLIGLIPMFILPWPRTVNKRMIWLLAGCFLFGLAIFNLLQIIL